MTTQTKLFVLAFKGCGVHHRGLISLYDSGIDLSKFLSICLVYLCHIYSWDLDFEVQKYLIQKIGI